MNTKILATILVVMPGICFRAAAQNTVTDTLEFGKDMVVAPASLIQGKMSGVRVSSVDGNDGTNAGNPAIVTSEGTVLSEAWTGNK